MKAPLADRLRPESLGEVVGQDHLLGPDGFLTKTIAAGRPSSIILWGPPGCGKTTIARLYAKSFNAQFVSFSAVFGGISDLRKVVADAEAHPLLGLQTVLFVDEIHRFNKAQQDGFLPYVEKGTFVLVGATTENPSFSLNNALLSRTRVLEVHALSRAALEALLARYEARVGPLALNQEDRAALIDAAQGDGRYLLGLIENHDAGLHHRMPLYDRSGEGHFNLISALHKSVRGSDANAALYWLARMLEGGEDPLYIARRLIRIALEDIGLADPEALKLAITARDAYQMLGSPEGDLALAEVTLYLALAPKSRAVNDAFESAKKAAQQTGHLSPPKSSCNAPTPMMKELRYGQPNPDDTFFPTEVNNKFYYKPVPRGFEREMLKRIEFFSKNR